MKSYRLIFGDNMSKVIKISEDLYNQLKHEKEEYFKKTGKKTYIKRLIEEKVKNHE